MVYTLDMTQAISAQVLKKVLILALAVFLTGLQAMSQTAQVSGKVLAAGEGLEFVNVGLLGTTYGITTSADGSFNIEGIKAGKYRIRASFVGFIPVTKTIELAPGEQLKVNFALKEDPKALESVVVTGTMKEISRLESPVPVEVYTPKFFRKNPTPNIYDALQNVNGVRPQLNCNICNTGDIHINGLEGPYTFVLIDGMPIVSGLSTVYGLSGIPNSLVERIEIVKGPASSLYGSEAVGGLINIITKKPINAPLLALDVFGTSWQEYNLDLGLKLAVGSKATALTGINYFNYQNVVDNNGDNFTDLTLQDRISVFQKWSFDRRDNKVFTLAGRYYYEDRWGGDVNWNESFRGGDEVYGESIFTNRWELIGQYQLPVKEKVMFSFSFNDHDQNSRYGDLAFDARQRIAFSQFTWDKKVNNHDLLFGTALRYTYYDDNTTATANNLGTEILNNPEEVWLPGFFVQDEITLPNKNKLLLGARFDHDNRHGSIFTPRIAYKWSLGESSSLRFNAGTGFRVINLFTEDHAALTGARDVEVVSELNPEQSYNFNLNYLGNFYTNSGTFIGLDASVFYTFFDNRIIPDYESDPNKIIYDNTEGAAVTRGISANLDVSFPSGLKLLAGVTYQDVFSEENGVKETQLLTERFSGTWSVTYDFSTLPLSIDYTGNLYSPMRLPLLGELDPRDPESPWWSIQNIQLTYRFDKIEIYGGVKNLLNWTPGDETSFLLARPEDPFDRNVQFDAGGQVVPTADNPYALTFDPTYVYASNQGIRGFLGFRLSID